jgi:quercetin dioxygenase-like cupin family protein
MTPLFVPPGGGMAVENPVGGVLTFKLTSGTSRGALTAFDTVAAPREGPPLHLHAEDEIISILEGTFRVKLGDAIYGAPPGSFVFIPRGTPHTWQNAGAEPARFFAALLPAQPAFEEFFVRYANLPAAERGVEAFTRLAAETEALRVVGPPLAQSDPV